jgi:flavin reductase (DIM6/NTAB) family NADH-FMN oxidoreductase RutF
LTPLACASGAPLLPNALVVFECEAYGRHDGGDHEILVGRVVALHENPAKHAPPLVFYEGRYRQLSRAEAAHAPPSEAVFLHGW